MAVAVTDLDWHLPVHLPAQFLPCGKRFKSLKAGHISHILRNGCFLLQNPDHFGKVNVLNHLSVGFEAFVRYIVDFHFLPLPFYFSISKRGLQAG